MSMNDHSGFVNQFQQLLGLEGLYAPKRNHSVPFYHTRRRQLLFQKHAKLNHNAEESDAVENVKNDSSFLGLSYIRVRQKLLMRHFGIPYSNHSRGASHVSSRMSNSGMSEENTDYFNSSQNYRTRGHLMIGIPEGGKASVQKDALSPNHQNFPRGLANASEVSLHGSKEKNQPLHGQTHLSSITLWSCIRDQHKQPASAIHFAHGDDDRFACASLDGTISIFSISTNDKGPLNIHRNVSLEQCLKGHSKGITDFAWSSGNDFILSSSLDFSLRLWESQSGRSLREINVSSECLRCLFTPGNSNLFIVGTQDGRIREYNLSTGKEVQTMSLGGAVNAITFNPEGDLLFAGDENGVVHIFRFGFDGSIRRLKRMEISVGKHAITSLSCCKEPLKITTATGGTSWVGGQMYLLVSCKDNHIRLFRVEFRLQKRIIHLQIRQTFPLKHQFCNIISRLFILTSPQRFSSNAKDAMVTGNNDVSEERAGQDGRFLTLLSGSEDMFIHYCIIPTGAGNAGYTSHMSSMASPISPTGAIVGGSVLGNGNANGPLQLQRLPFYEGHQGPVLSLSWNTKQTLMCSCDTDGIICLWQRE